MNTFGLNSEDSFQAVDFLKENLHQKIQSMIKEESWDEALTTITSHMDSEQGNAEFLMAASEIYTKTADYPAALKTFHMILDILSEKDPTLFEVYKNMGNIYLKCGDIEAAEEKYNLANAINNQDENLIINYGVLAIQKGKYTEAKARFAQVLEGNGASDLAWVGLGLVHRSYSDHDLARACLLRGLDENPYNKLAISNYYQWCYQDGVDTTSQYIKDFLTKYPDDAEINKLASGLSQ